ncbi:MAG TPA: type II toxin-antitoxin system antitoxin SocA domain-containing protein [Puia sp.]|nr:type II toxin-antitoxin system antitoxin SocA domain-containing protein [Puia sp.]
MPYFATQIAGIFVKIGIAEKNYLSQMKLQKVVFFAHGYHLAKYDEPLIKEEFQAWKFGPVVQSIYHEFKLYGSSPIADTDFIDFFIDLDPKKLSDAAQDTINYSWEVTKGLTAYELSNWTHSIGSPWQQSYNPKDREIIIKNDLIKDYFKDIVLENANTI